MRYVFPSLILLTLAVQTPAGFIALLVPISFTYMIGLMQDFWCFHLVPSIPIHMSWKKYLASPTFQDTHCRKRLCTTRKDHIKVHILVQEAPSQLALVN